MTPSSPFPADEPESWPVESSTDLHRDAWVVAFRSDQVRRPAADGEEPFRRLVLEHPGAAMVMALDDDDRVFCLRQYRHPAQRRFLEFPAGVCDEAGEDPFEVAVRELREEAALQASEWTHLLSTWSSPGISAEQMHIFVARDLAPADRGDFVLAHEEADMDTLWVPFADLVVAVLEGRVADGPVVQAVLAEQVLRSRT
jgi:8-oxo-dGTP pyrophosphatase MutT (NUDIX family)